MIITELNLKHYGKFENQIIRFRRGMNIMYGENGSGKSTIADFIRDMLFGLEKGRARGGRPDAYRMRQPWDNPGFFEGGMRMEHEGKVYYLERSFSHYEKRVRMVCETDRTEIRDVQGMLRHMAGDLDEEVWHAAFFRGDGAALGDQTLSAVRRTAIKAGVSAVSADASEDPEIACVWLAAKRKRAAERRQQLERESRQYADRRLAELETLRADRENLLNMAQRGSGGHNAIQSGDFSGGEGSDRPDDARFGSPDSSGRRSRSDDAYPGGGLDPVRKRLRLILVFLCLTGAVLSLILALAGTDPMRKKMLFGLCAALVLLALILLLLVGLGSTDSRETGSVDKPGRADAGQMQEQGLRKTWSEEEAREQRLRKVWLEEQAQEKEKRIQALKEEISAQGSPDREIAACEEEIAAIDLAIQAIRDAAGGLSEKDSRGFEDTMSEILSQLSEGKYTGASFDEKEGLRVAMPGRLLQLWQLGSGERSQAWFSMLLAAREWMGAVQLPLILDDAFSTYDDEHLEQALRCLLQMPGQIILLTSQSREERIVGQIGSAGVS